MSKDNYQMVEVEKIGFPSFMPKSEPPTTDLITSISSNGILQPIGICRNDAKEIEEYKYLVIWGRKRLLAAHNLNIKRIPAVIIDIKPSREEFLKYLSMISHTSVRMSLVDVWNAIRELYLIHGDEKIVSEMSGFPLKVVKDAVFENIVKNISGGPELIDYCRNECNLPNRVFKDIFYLLIDNENHSVDQEKGKKLADVLAVQDVQMQNRVLKAAIANPKGDVDGWVADAKTMRNYKKRTIDDLSIELIEEEDYGLLKMAEANGLTVNELINKIVKDKLYQEGFLEDK